VKVKSSLAFYNLYKGSGAPSTSFKNASSSDGGSIVMIIYGASNVEV